MPHRASHHLMDSSVPDAARSVRQMRTASLPHMTRVERWERRVEIPLLLLALAFLVGYAWPILNPRLDPGIETFLTVVSWTVWAVFVIDFVIRLTLAEDRGRYAVQHWYDVLLIVLPMLRPLRLLRILVFARLLAAAFSAPWLVG
jgi:voltage-gated potassium channel